MSIVRTGIRGFDQAAAMAEAARQVAVASASSQVLAAQAEVVFYVTILALGQQYGVSVGAANDALLQLQGLPPPLQN